MITFVSPAIEAEALLTKSRFYITKALQRRASGDHEEYQLWSSLALELLGKAALSKVHPCLVVDPTHAPSLFVAAGIAATTDVKTITAKTLFERLKQLSTRFDEAVRVFCVEVSQRRNAELHSGEVPFRTTKAEAWEGRFWRACVIILELVNLTLEEWIGDEEAADARRSLNLSEERIRLAVLVKMEEAKEYFGSLPQKERDSLRFESETKFAFHYTNLFHFMNEHEWPLECPVCRSRGFLAGDYISEEITDTDYAELWEMVRREYLADEFHCPVCNLHFVGREELEVAGLDLGTTETEERQIDYEPDYGND